MSLSIRACVGEASYVGGQEDMIIDVTLQLVDERDRTAR
jgi:4-hydroxy 2-oxovalerate aldolase